MLFRADVPLVLTGTDCEVSDGGVLLEGSLYCIEGGIVSLSKRARMLAVEDFIRSAAL